MGTIISAEYTASISGMVMDYYFIIVLDGGSSMIR
jgi:hypothetical protein